ncbi:MAG: ABC transporter ATP-binding protein, partial [Bacillota bacterium]
MIKVNHLHKYFNRFKKNEIHVLNDINLEFPEKGLVVLLGPSGSGKTTLLNVLGGLDKVQSGTIDFDHTQIEGYDAGTWEKIRNEAVGYIFQNYNLLPELSVFDNVAFVLKMIGIHDPKVIEDRVHYILNAVNMFPYRKKRALQLSGGQQQRVAIARALVKNPRIIIADEPTGNLDSKNTLEIMNIIKQISMEKLVVLVTHERDIAQFYGDRIIELKDGQIISDTDNHTDHDHSFSNDDIIYLKDLNQLADSESAALKTALYKDHQEDEQPISVRLIVKNKTLYLEVDAPYQKVKLIDKNSGVIIKDEHFVKKTREEMIETSFDLGALDNKEVHRQPKLLVSMKQIVWMALVKIAKTSRKGKIMLFSFLIAGMVIAFTISFLASVVVLEPEKYIELGTDYVSVNSYIVDDFYTYEELLAFGEDDEHFQINSYVNFINFRFLLNSDNRQNDIYTRIDYYDDIKKSDLLRGELPTSPYDVLLSKALAEDIVKGSSGQSIGIWSYRHLLEEKIELGQIVVNVVGIVDAEQNLIYLDPMTAQYAYDAQQYDIDMTGYEIFTDQIDLVIGAYPVNNQVIIRESTYNLFPSVHALPFPKTIPGVPYPVSGVYDSQIILPTFLSTYVLAESVRFEENRSFFLRTSDKKALIEDLESEFSGILVTDLYQQALNDAKNQRDIVLYSSLGTAGFIV